MSRGVGLALSICLILPFLVAGERGKDLSKLKREEAADYYDKWLEQEVPYIITDDERSAFKPLTTDEEREVFIEQFWANRDPDPRTPTNEFKEEHYRRIAYANERFASGVPGWRTDRGKIYIIHGKPDEVEAHPTGGPYERPMEEGGGESVAYPFEVWRYRHIDGMGEDIQLTFVDQSNSGAYELSLNPETDKDALLHVPNAGPTILEQMGLSTWADRPYFNPGSQANNLGGRHSAFDRYELYTKVQKAPEMKYPELRDAVSVEIHYEQLKYETRHDFIRLNDSQVLVPITVRVANREMTFKEENGVLNGRLAVYGIVKSLANRIIVEFDDDIIASYTAGDRDRSLAGSSLYQKVITLDAHTLHRLDLVVKDLHSGRIGVATVAIVPPTFDASKISLSSMLLSDHILRLPSAPTEREMFVLGDLKIRPSVDNRFLSGKGVSAYLELYNVELDQSTLAPALAVKYQVKRDGATVVEWVEETGQSIHYFSPGRVILLKSLRTAGLPAGRYQLSVEARDLIRAQVAETSQYFELIE